MKRYLLGAILLLATMSLAAENKPRTVFMYGFAASFNDSTVYFTEIQQVDSAYIDSKTNFLYSRSNYSYQLRDYLTSIGFDTPTCITSFATNRKEAEKKYLALRKRYTTGGRYNVKNLSESDFRFTAVKEEKVAEKPSSK